MDVRELRGRITRALNAGTLTMDDEVFVRNPEVSAEAIEAGSNGWVASGTALVISEARGDLAPGLYLEPEED